MVQVVCGTVLAAAGEYDKAVELLGKHQGNLEACVFLTDPRGIISGRPTNGQSNTRVALLTQIHLVRNRTDLALKEVQAAKRWAQDSLLINLAEAWVGLRAVCPSLPLSQFLSIPHVPTNKHMPGRRQIPIDLLHLRRAGRHPDHHHPFLPRRPSSRRHSPRPPARGRSDAATGARARSGRCTGACEQCGVGVLDGEDEGRGGGLGCWVGGRG